MQEPPWNKRTTPERWIKISVCVHIAKAVADIVVRFFTNS
ncbi:hypothetical protein GCWB2_23895 (plasmid) [Gordonia rubripertincta]|nr:hypothetical protein GCWB2_23895 [Gordonia rubripertincta]